ncbi:hypothetical protein EYF80_039746 [Liparis tanakae]|uniref:Uncharacterized protein n=1 Tax=Liparis tanakae TaxID=230148 RepID=A0A4Z2G975_9TELE|nr:hypothetical protein EYF80_039746 [Liparis tanakae]
MSRPLAAVSGASGGLRGASAAPLSPVRRHTGVTVTRRTGPHRSTHGRDSSGSSAGKAKGFFDCRLKVGEPFSLAADRHSLSDTR